MTEYVSTWLIERNPEQGERPMWWNVAMHTWVTDAWFAQRYPDEATCRRAIVFLLLEGQCRPVEHGFGL